MTAPGLPDRRCSPRRGAGFGVLVLATLLIAACAASPSAVPSPSRVETESPAASPTAIELLPEIAPTGSPPTWELSSPGGFAFGFGSAWVVANGDLLRIDPATNRTVASVRIGSGAAWPVIALESVWVRTPSGTLRVDPATNEVVGQIAAGRVFGFDSFWDVSGGMVQRINPQTGEIVAQIQVQEAVDWEPQLAVGAGAVWIGSGDEHAVMQIDPTTNRVTNTITGLSADYSLLAVGVDFDAVWAHANAGGSDGTLYRIDPASGTVVAVIPVSDQVGGQYGGTNIGFGGGAVWTANASGTISRIDPETNAVRATMPTVAEPLFIAYGFDAVWVCSEGTGRVVRIDAAEFR